MSGSIWSVGDGWASPELASGSRRTIGVYEMKKPTVAYGSTPSTMPSSRPWPIMSMSAVSEPVHLAVTLASAVRMRSALRMTPGVLRSSALVCSDDSTSSM